MDTVRSVSAIFLFIKCTNTAYMVCCPTGSFHFIIIFSISRVHRAKALISCRMATAARDRVPCLQAGCDGPGPSCGCGSRPCTGPAPDPEHLASPGHPSSPWRTNRPDRGRRRVRVMVSQPQRATRHAGSSRVQATREQPIRQMRLIPTCTDQNSCAHWRHPMEAMRSGWSEL